MTTDNYYRRVTFTLLILAVIVLGILLILYSSRFFLLYFIAILISIPLRKGGTWISKLLPGGERVGVSIVALLFALLVGGLFWFIGPQLADQADQLMQSFQQAMLQMKQWLQGRQWGKVLLARIPTNEIKLTGTAGIVPNPFQAIGSIISSTISPILTLVVLYIVGIMLALNPSLYQGLVIYALPDKARPRVREYFAKTGDALAFWLLARFASMLAIGILTYIGLLLLGVPVPLTLAMIAALLSFIPNIGPILSVIPAALVGLASGGFTMLLYVIVLYIILQTVESYFITPWVERRTVSLPPALTIFVQLVLTFLMGIIGAVVAAPLIVTLMLAAKLFYYPYVLKKSEDELELYVGPEKPPT